MNKMTHEEVKALNIETITPAQVKALASWEISAHHATGCNGSWSQREGACTCGLMHARGILETLEAG